MKSNDSWSRSLVSAAAMLLVSSAVTVLPVNEAEAAGASYRASTVRHHRSTQLRDWTVYVPERQLTVEGTWALSPDYMTSLPFMLELVLDSETTGLWTMKSKDGYCYSGTFELNGYELGLEGTRCSGETNYMVDMAGEISEDGVLTLEAAYSTPTGGWSVGYSGRKASPR